jgi:hypothetical protein
LDALNAETTAYVDGKTHRIVHQYYAQTCHLTFRWEMPDWNPPVLRWAVLIGDVIHELSTALDHIAWQLALKARAKPGSSTAWPVCVGEGAWESKTTQDMVKHIGADDRAFIESKQPYPAPDGLDPKTHAFAMLRLLSRIDKHRVLHTAVVMPLETDVEFVDIRDIAAIKDIRVYDEPMKNRAKILRVLVIPSGPSPDMDMKARQSLYVAFIGPEYGHMDKGAVFLVCRIFIKEVSKLIEEAAVRF